MERTASFFLRSTDLAVDGDGSQVLGERGVEKGLGEDVVNGVYVVGGALKGFGI